MKKLFKKKSIQKNKLEILLVRLLMQFDIYISVELSIEILRYFFIHIARKLCIYIQRTRQGTQAH